jgi:hypothetical protein
MMEQILESTIIAQTGSYPFEARHLNAQMIKPCPNKHISAFPGVGRVKCQCGKAYIRK